MTVIELLVYITCFCLAQDFVFCDDYGESGNDITLTPSIRGKPLDILWRHNGNKVLEYDGSKVVKYGLFEDRVDVDFETGQLIIRKLNIQDSGKYQSEILINGIVQTSSHTLTVLDALPEPQVTCEVGENSNVKKLSCSVESQTQPSYEWSGPGIKQPGPTLLVNEQEEKHDSVYTCTVKNKAGIKTTDFNLQDCHTGGVSLAVLVPVLIVAVLFIILLAVLALFLYRHKKQKWKSELKKMHSENGECDDLLINVSPEVIPGSSEATLPCHIRLTAPKESIADKKWDQDSESENAGETHERQKLLQESPQSAITEKNKEVTGNTNERELGKNEKNGKNADDAEENANSKPDETAIEVESPKSLQTQEENEKSQILKNESEDKEESPEKQIEPLGEQETKDADKNEEDQTPGEIKEKEEENKDIDSPNTETESPQSAVTERNKMDKGYVAEQLHNNEKNSQNENDEQSHEEQNKSLSTDINEDDQRPEDEKEVEVKTEEEIYRPLTESPANLEKEPINSSVPSSDQTALINYTDQDKRQTDINMENKLPGEEQNEKEKVLTTEELKGSQEQMAEENKHDSVLSEPQISIHSDKQGKQIDPDSTINSVSQQQCHNDGLSKEDGISCEAVPAYSEKLSNTDKKQDNELFDNDAEITQNEEQTEVESEKDDDSEQRDKSSESEQSMENDVPEIKETKNKHLKDCDVKNSNPDNTNNDIYVPEDKKAKTETDSFLKHHSAEIREQDLNKQSCTECDNTVYSEEGKMGSVLSAVKEEEKICQLEPREGSSVS